MLQSTVRVGCGDDDQYNPGFGNIVGCYHFIICEIEVIPIRIRSEKGCLLLLLFIIYEGTISSLFTGDQT